MILPDLEPHLAVAEKIRRRRACRRLGHVKRQRAGVVHGRAGDEADGGAGGDGGGLVGALGGVELVAADVGGGDVRDGREAVEVYCLADVGPLRRCFAVDDELVEFVWVFVSPLDRHWRPLDGREETDSGPRLGMSIGLRGGA